MYPGVVEGFSVSVCVGCCCCGCCSDCCGWLPLRSCCSCFCCCCCCCSCTMRRRFSVDLTDGMSTSTRSGADIILAMVGGVNKFQYRYRYGLPVVSRMDVKLCISLLLAYKHTCCYAIRQTLNCEEIHRRRVVWLGWLIWRR